MKYLIVIGLWIKTYRMCSNSVIKSPTKFFYQKIKSDGRWKIGGKNLYLKANIPLTILLVLKNTNEIVDIIKNSMS